MKKQKNKNLQKQNSNLAKKNVYVNIKNMRDEYRYPEETRHLESSSTLF